MIILNPRTFFNFLKSSKTLNLAITIFKKMRFLTFKVVFIRNYTLKVRNIISLRFSLKMVIARFNVLELFKRLRKVLGSKRIIVIGYPEFTFLLSKERLIKLLGS